MVIGIDFDGVIAKRQGIPTLKQDVDTLMPMEGAKDSIKLMIELGHQPYVFTSNKDVEGIKNWLCLFKFPELEITNIKKEGTQLYIDDRAYRFTNWQDVRKLYS